MNRRTFARNVAGALLASSASPALLRGDTAASPAAGVRYKLSVMLWTILPKLPVEQRLEKIAEAGYHNVELVREYQNWSEDDFQRVIARSKELGISFDCTAGIRRSIANPNERGAFVEDVGKELQVMERLNSAAMIILTGNVVPGLSMEAQQQSCVDALAAAAKVVEGKKINGEPVRLLLENIDPEENPKYFLTSVARGFEIVKAVNHPQVQFLYDFFHEQISEGNLIEKLAKNIEHVGLVHVADVPGRHEPGTGEINYAGIYRKLVELKYDRMVAMEFLPSGDPVAQLRAARVMAEKGGEG